jgi:hypothetical protein
MTATMTPCRPASPPVSSHPSSPPQADILPDPANYARDSNFINLPSDLSRPFTEMLTGFVLNSQVRRRRDGAWRSMHGALARTTPRPLSSSDLWCRPLSSSTVPHPTAPP